MPMKEMKQLILDKTNQVFEQTLNEKENSQNLLLLNTYFSWMDFIEGQFASKDDEMQLLVEATLDLVNSLFNTFSGFYRGGMISLRSALELTGLYVYYFDHHIEYKYFANESKYKGPLLSELINSDKFLMNMYCSLFIDVQRLKGSLHEEVLDTYRTLSQYVHGRLGKLQSIKSLPINFSKSDFSKFTEQWQKVIGLGNTILAIRFSKEVDKMDKDKKDVIYGIIQKLGFLEV
jgi:hypothetical protein